MLGKLRKACSCGVCKSSPLWGIVCPGHPLLREAQSESWFFGAQGPLAGAHLSWEQDFFFQTERAQRACLSAPPGTKGPMDNPDFMNTVRSDLYRISRNPTARSRQDCFPSAKRMKAAPRDRFITVDQDGKVAITVPMFLLIQDHYIPITSQALINGIFRSHGFCTVGEMANFHNVMVYNDPSLLPQAGPDAFFAALELE